MEFLKGPFFSPSVFVVYTAFRIYFHFYADDTQTNKYVLTFVASGLNINGCVLSYFEGIANLHCYKRCTLTTLHCSKV